MASARKDYARTKPQHVAAPKTEQAEKASFVDDVLRGAVQAKSVVTKRNPQGRFTGLAYDEPNGPGAGPAPAGDTPINQGNRST